MDSGASHPKNETERPSNPKGKAVSETRFDDAEYKRWAEKLQDRTSGNG